MPRSMPHRQQAPNNVHVNVTALIYLSLRGYWSNIGTTSW